MLILLAFISDNALPLPVNTPVFAVILAAVIVPLTPRLVSVPTLVIFGCALVVTVAAVVAAPLNAPTKVFALILFAITLPEVTLPVTVKLVSVPTLVIFG